MVFSRTQPMHEQDVAAAAVADPAPGGAQGIHVRADLLRVSVPKLVNGATNLLIGLVSMRFLDPAGYGVLCFGLSMLTLFDGLVGSALDLATIGLFAGGGRSNAPIQAGEKAVVWLKVCAGAVMMAVCTVVGERLGWRFFHTDGGRGYFVILAAAAAGLLLFRSVQVYFQARLRFWAYGGADFAHAALRVFFVAVALFEKPANPVAVLAAFAAAPLTIAAAFLVYARLFAGWRAVSVARSDVDGLLKEVAPSLATFGVSGAVGRLDVLLTAAYGTVSDLGLYTGALLIASIPEFLAAYFAPVFLPRILPACRNGTFAKLFRTVHLWVFLACAGLMAAAMLGGRPAISFILPSAYASSVGLILILLPGTLATASYYPLTMNFLMLRKSKAYLIADAVAAPVLIVSYYLLIPVYGVMAAAWVTCVHRLLKAAAMQAFAFRAARRVC